jgi:release factor glutamine methyltransferase
MADLASSFRDVLREGKRRLKDPRFAPFEAEELLSHSSGQPRSFFLAHGLDVCPEKTARGFFDLIDRRLEGHPLQYLLGEWEFLGRTFRVDSRALIPRGETERIVEIARELAPLARRIVDAGTGSGILAVSLALERPAARLLALDISLSALALARQNARKFGVETRVDFVGSDWLSAVVSRPVFDLAVANPPYVPLADAPHLDKTVSEHEPAAALYGGDDGLDHLRHLAHVLPERLLPGSYFLFEFGYGQARAVSEIFDAVLAWELRDIRLDPAGIPRTGVAWRRD